MSLGHLLSDSQEGLLQLSILSLIALYFFIFFDRSADCDNDLQIANRSFSLEPRILGLVRWALRARTILDSAYKTLDGSVYKIARGDLDLVVVPSSFIPELNLLPDSIISSKKAHSYNLTGRFNGIDIVTRTALHVTALQHKLTPSLPRLLEPIKTRVTQTISRSFPQESETWSTVEPMEQILYCVSQITSLIAVGTPLCDNPDYVRLTSEHAEHVFSITIILRMIPAFVRPLIVWLLPAKWRLERSLQGMESFVVPEVKRRREQENPPVASDMLSWMMEKAANQQESDPKFLTLLQAVLAAGATHTTAIIIFNTLFDLATHPHFLAEIREEISAKNQDKEGVWDQATFDSLYKLDSAMKETMRLNPASLTAYSRAMQKDFTLSNGVTLKRGSLICTSSYSKQLDHTVFADPGAYDALRAYNQDFEAHRAQPLKSIDEDGLRWGTGRWACPGRFFASLEAKVILVKLVDEFDIKLLEGQTRPASKMFHEFIFADSHAKLQMRRRTRPGNLY